MLRARGSSCHSSLRHIGGHSVVGSDNTALAFYADDEVVLVDCSGSPYQKILKAGLDPMKVSALIVTHGTWTTSTAAVAGPQPGAGRPANTLHLYALPETMQSSGVPEPLSPGRQHALSDPDPRDPHKEGHESCGRRASGSCPPR